MTRPAEHDPLKLAHAQEVLGHFQQIEDQFHQVRDGLEHLQRLATLGTLASMVAHEFNNILTPVISYAQMALANPSDAELTRKALEKALSGAQRAAKISDSMLGFSREEDSGTQADLRAVVREALGCLAREPGRDGIEVKIDVPDVQVAIAPISLQQVLLNLILNANYAMRRAGGVLSIVARVQGENVLIDVSDTGGGVPSQIADRLFEPFVTQDSTDESAARTGTGLGLCICRGLIDKAGGAIHLGNQSGQGATFHITLPQASPLRKSA